MPKFLEKKLKRRYGADSPIPYKIMNAEGFMRGNRETSKGRAAEEKHQKKIKLKTPIKGLGGAKEIKKKKKKKSEEGYDPFARAMNA